MCVRKREREKRKRKCNSIRQRMGPWGERSERKRRMKESERPREKIEILNARDKRPRCKVGERESESNPTILDGLQRLQEQ